MDATQAKRPAGRLMDQAAGLFSFAGKKAAFFVWKQE
jgi:hypothetical protein